ncbi:MAG: DUF6177 family protein [Actinomycetota bacterium]
MSEDWLVTGTTPLGLTEMVAAVGRLIPELSLRGDHSGQSVVIVHQDRPVVWISPSREVKDPRAPWVPGNPSLQPGWWSEVTGPTHLPVPGYDNPRTLIRDVAQAFGAVLGGQAVRLSTTKISPHSHSESAREIPSVTTDVDTPCDFVTNTLAVLMQSRAQVALTPWLIHNHTWATTHERQFVLLTPATTELTMSAWHYLHNTDNTAWIVDAGDAMYHGLSGLEVTWENDEFVLHQQLHPRFAPNPEDPWVLWAQAETTHAYRDSLSVGSFSREILSAICPTSPIRQGLLEPPESLFDITQLTEYARSASPDPTRFVMNGEGWEAVIETVPQPIGVVERVTACVHPVRAVADHDLAARFTERAAVTRAESALIGHRRVSPGGFMPSRMTGPTIPAAVYLARSRYPTLNETEARQLGESGYACDRHGHTFTWDLNAASDADDSSPRPTNPARALMALMSNIQHHDSHQKAAAS